MKKISTIKIISLFFTILFFSKKEAVAQTILDYATITGIDGVNASVEGYSAHSITDSGDNLYILSKATSVSTYTSVGAYQSTYGGGQDDIYLQKFDKDGNLLWATFYGGSNAEAGASLEIVGNQLILSGRTWSADLPGTHSYTMLDATSDRFHAVFDLDGNFIQNRVYTTEGEETHHYTEVDDTYIYTFLQRTDGDGLRFNEVTKVEIATLNQIYKSRFDIEPQTFSNTRFSSFQLDWEVVNGQVYVYGQVSHSYMQLVNEFNTHNGTTDNYIGVLDSNGDLIFGSYIGGPRKGSNGAHIEYDETTNQIILAGIVQTGTPGSNTFPTTSDAFMPTYTDGQPAAYFMKINDSTFDIDFSTYYGAVSNQNNLAIGALWNMILLPNGDLAAVGLAAGSNLLVTADAFRTATVDEYPGTFGNDYFVVKIGRDNSLVYSSYFGTRDNDGQGFPIMVNRGNDIAILGQSGGYGYNYPPFTATQNPLPGQGDPNGSYDNRPYLAVINEDNSVPLATYVGGIDEGEIENPTGAQTWASNMTWSDKGLALFFEVDDGNLGETTPILTEDALPVNGNEHAGLFTLINDDFELEYQSYLNGLGAVQSTGDDRLILPFGDGFYLLETSQRATAHSLTTEGAFLETTTSSSATWMGILKVCDSIDFVNNISTTSTTVCLNGLPDLLDGDVASEVLPRLNNNGTYIDYEFDEGSYSYQWEMSLDNVNWADISGATLEDCQPDPIAVTTYFRRRVTLDDDCNNPDYSNVITITPNTTVTETADAGWQFCYLFK